MTVVDRAVRSVEVAGAVQQVPEVCSVEAVLAPLDLRRGACPRLPFEDRPAAFAKYAIKPAVVRDDEDHGVVDEGVHGGLVDSMAAHYFVGDAGKRDLSRDQLRRFVEGGERAADADDATVRAVVELDHAELYDLVPGVIEAVVSVSSRMPVRVSRPDAGIDVGYGTMRRSTRESVDWLKASAITAGSDAS
ncbi:MULTISPECIES: hypothetical protein [Bradyrhizobium]|uniref:hypothetical protein n=1 Tax=Bradyrhizobium TaxID=374 RepID=UPI00293E0B26|nr:hypothetical protein [Bradyrhizobium sp. BWC-3-1]WOH56904.1 hypothetical protein RX329_32360 [Bradyrhizobium sp. BWC-3-1]